MVPLSLLLLSHFLLQSESLVLLLYRFHHRLSFLLIFVLEHASHSVDGFSLVIILPIVRGLTYSRLFLTWSSKTFLASAQRPIPSWYLSSIACGRQKKDRLPQNVSGLKFRPFYRKGLYRISSLFASSYSNILF